MINKWDIYTIAMFNNQRVTPYVFDFMKSPKSLRSKSMNLGKIYYFTNLNSSANYWDDFPKINHDSRAREDSEVVIIYPDIYIYIYICTVYIYMYSIYIYVQYI